MLHDGGQIGRFMMRYPYVFIVLWISLIFCPFLGKPVLQTTGDQKVYIAQALEMHAQNHWLKQTLAGQGYYYKGPMHYILLRIGFNIFGVDNLWAGQWMNLICLLIVGLGLTRVTIVATKNPHLAVTLGMASTIAGGIYAHAFASQMELELCAIYTLCLVLLQAYLAEISPAKSKSLILLLWILIGVASTVKSPLHSVLLGIGTLMALALVGRKKRNLILSRWHFLVILAGIALAVMSYGLLYWLDEANFYLSYIVRETLGKGPNEVSSVESWLPNLTTNLLPVTPIILAGLYGLRHLKLRQEEFSGPLSTGSDRETSASTLAVSGLCLILPTFIFFAIHPYRSPIYTIPCIPVVIAVAGMGLFMGSSSDKKGFPLWIPKMIPYFGLLLPITYIVLRFRFLGSFFPLPEFLTFGAVIATIGTIFSVFILRKLEDLWSPLWIFSLVPCYLFLGSLLHQTGKFEIDQFNKTLSMMSHRDQNQKIGFYNLHRHTWSEWGLLTLASQRTIVGLHHLPSLQDFLNAGGYVIFPGKSFLDDFLSKSHGERYEIREWKKWYVRGPSTSESGTSAAWLHHDIGRVMTSYFIVAKDSREFNSYACDLGVFATSDSLPRGARTPKGLVHPKNHRGFFPCLYWRQRRPRYLGLDLDFGPESLASFYSQNLPNAPSHPRRLRVFFVGLDAAIPIKLAGPGRLNPPMFDRGYYENSAKEV